MGNGELSALGMYREGTGLGQGEEEERLS